MRLSARDSERLAGRRGDGEAGGLGNTSPRLPVAASARRRERGWTLIELMVAVTILTILTMGVIPLARNQIRRQKEYRLREALREMREAIKEFHRDTVGAPCCVQPGAVQQQQQQQQQGQALYLDPRSKVMISDRTIFDTRNLDHYPPTLDTLVKGVSVVSRLQTGLPDPNKQATENGALVSLQKKVYLRRIPDDPMTDENETDGEAEWGMRSCYDEPDSDSWGGENVFDVYSKSEETPMSGEGKYSDW